jgi:hypothetical protein
VKRKRQTQRCTPLHTFKTNKHADTYSQTKRLVFFLANKKKEENELKREKKRRDTEKEEK